MLDMTERVVETAVDMCMSRTSSFTTYAAAGGSLDAYTPILFILADAADTLLVNCDTSLPSHFAPENSSRLAPCISAQLSRWCNPKEL